MPWPKSEDELLDVMREALGQVAGKEGVSGYNASAESLWKCAVAAFNYASHVVGATGFQAGWASLKFYGTVNHIDGPYIVYRGSDMLYPQYQTPVDKAREWQEDHEFRQWLKEEAQKRISEVEARGGDDFLSTRVYEHWKKLAKYMESPPSEICDGCAAAIPDGETRRHVKKQTFCLRCVGPAKEDK